MNADVAKLEPKTRESLLLWVIPIGIAAWLLTTPSNAQTYEGDWNRVSLKFTVNVESWGKDCGARPRSYNSKAVKPTEILQNNGHLFFSTGGLRTDRCNSPNPSLSTLTTSRSNHMWTRTCETPGGSGRYEKIDYTFSGSGDRLTYMAESSFRWSLNDDLCVVSWVERRTWEKRTAMTEEPETENADSPILKVHEDDSFSKKSKAAVRPECESPGKTIRLTIAPKKARVSPSESLCFQIRGVDGEGCRFPIAAKWTASQNGVAQNHLMNAKGCFVAGDNAAESEGIFQVFAEYRGISVQSMVEVKYPDIGDLALARLDLSDEIETQDSESTSLATRRVAPVQPIDPQNQPPILATKAEPDSSGNANWLVWLLTGAIFVFVAITVLLTIVLLRKPREESPESNVRSADESSSVRTRVMPAQVSPQQPKPSEPKPASSEMICPQCGARYPKDAKYCPEDATSLVEKQATEGSIRSSFPPPRGMICPACKRGYDFGAQFCPHDSSALIEYEKWRKRSR